MKRRFVMVLALLPVLAFWGCGTDTTTTTPDTTPPLAPQIGGATLQDGSVGVWWSANTEPDLAGYYVYYVENGTTHSASTDPVTSNYLVITSGNSGPVDVYVTAIDYSGNESSPSVSVRASAQITDPDRQIIGGSPKDF